MSSELKLIIKFFFTTTTQKKKKRKIKSGLSIYYQAPPPGIEIPPFYYILEKNLLLLKIFIKQYSRSLPLVFILFLYIKTFKINKFYLTNIFSFKSKLRKFYIMIKSINGCNRGCWHQFILIYWSNLFFSFLLIKFLYCDLKNKIACKSFSVL